MSEVPVTSAERDIPKTYLNNGLTFRSWLLTVDHKRIAILYLISLTIFFMIGAFGAAMIRLELVTPQADLLQSETYNKFFTMHGIVMIFFFLVPAVPAVMGNFLIPLMIGAKDVAFPKLNLLSWYVFMIGGIMAVGAIVRGGVDTGWTFYTPYSTMFANSYVAWAVAGAFLSGFSSILTSLNFIVTIQKMRAPGLTWFRLPLFIWGMYATGLMVVLGTPVVAITLVMIFVERVFHFPIFDPSIGGDPVLFQHLFWFYSHPAVYIMVIPSMGVISEIVACFSKRRIYGYNFVAYSSLAIAGISFLVWGHHLFVSSQSVYASFIFSFLTFFVAIPTSIKLLNWVMTMHRGSVSLDTPMLYAIGFIGLFLIGGLTGLYLSTLATDMHLTDTYFVISHFHYVMVGGGVMGFLGGLHFWWPKITGKLYPESWAKFAAIVIFVGFNFTFLPQLQMGYHGMPRRYHTYAPEYQVYHMMSTAGATVMGLGFILMFGTLVWAVFKGKPATKNPWGAKGLEWEKTPVVPPTENFTEPIVVTEEAYNYYQPGKPERGSTPSEIAHV